MKDNPIKQDLKQIEEILHELLRDRKVTTTTGVTFVHTLINLTAQYDALNDTFEYEQKLIAEQKDEQAKRGI